jgi:hypothetical protein
MYVVLGISMYVGDVESLDAKVAALRAAGWRGVNRSSLIRVALHALRPENVEPPPVWMSDSPRVKTFEAVEAAHMIAAQPAPVQASYERRRAKYATRNEEPISREVTCECGAVFSSKSRTCLPKLCPKCKKAHRTASRQERAATVEPVGAEQ